jgi:O-acetyl-ADP-ribose deacetylase (regulator of RNase III)
VSIKITKGDVLESTVDGMKVIVHCVNDINSFGSGIAGSIAKKWPHVKKKYHSWNTDLPEPFVLGQIQIVKAEANTFVCNLIGQRDIGGFQIGSKFIPPVRYEAIEEGFYRLLDRVEKFNGPEKISIHAPLLGTGLAGGNIDEIYIIANVVFGQSDIEFTFYAFSDSDWGKLQSIHEFIKYNESEEVQVLESLMGADEETVKEYQNNI